MNDTELIKTLHTLRTIEPNAQWLASSRANLISHIGAQESAFATSRSLSSIFYLLSSIVSTPARASFTTAVFAIAFFGVLGGLSTQSLPGEPLYSVKRTAEYMEFALPADEASQAKRDTEIAQRRVEELGQMAAKSENYAVQARAETYKETLAMSGNDGVETGPSAKESNIIKESAETLAMVLSSTNDESDFTTTLRVMIASRLTSCANEEMLANIQALLATGEVANLIEANELSVRCTE